MNKRVKKIGKFVLLSLLAILFLMPMYLVVINAFKPLGDILRSVVAFPKTLYLESFQYIFEHMDFFRILFNTFFVTVITVILVLILAPMCAYQLSRVDDKKSKVILMCLLSSMIIPFQTIMIPMVKIASEFHLLNSLWGLIVIEFTLNVPFTVFLYHGFIKKIPIDMDDSAKIDGCTPFGIFFKIIRPMLKSVNSTVSVIIALWVWNDFALPNVLIANQKKKMLTTTIYSFFSTVSMRWDYALAGLLLTALPIIIFFIIMQKQIINGMVEGAVK